MFDNWIARFKPTKFGNCVLWCDASQIRQAQGASVSSWTNLAVATNTPVTGGGGTAPTFQAAGTYGRPAVRFDGAENVLITPSAVLTDDDFTIFVVCRGDQTGSNDVVIGQQDGTATAGRWTLGNGATGPDLNVRWFHNDGAVSRSAETTSIGFDNTNPYVIRVRSDGAGNSSVGVNGGRDEALLTTGVAWTPQNTGMRIGGIAGQASSPSNDMSVDVQEIIIFSKLLSRTKQQIIERYLCHKWGITLN